MAAPSRGSWVASALLRGAPRICSRCAQGGQSLPGLLLRRAYSAVPVDSSPVIQPPSGGVETPPAFETPVVTATLPDLEETDYPKTTKPKPKVAIKAKDRPVIRSGVILTRAPLLMRETHPFENAYYLYQKRLNERLSAPFYRDAFFRPMLPATTDFKMKLGERRGVASREIGRYNPRGKFSWDDEVLVGSPLSDPKRLVRTLFEDAQMRISEDGEYLPPEERAPVEYPLPRRTEADEKNDQRRLDRALDKTLYLVVKKVWETGVGETEDAWVFPGDEVRKEEVLHVTAERALAESAGVNMNTWIIGSHPVAFVKTWPVLDEKSSRVVRSGAITFFLKGRIMAGQADLENNLHGIVDFKWLTQEELKEHLPRYYYHGVKGMFAER